MVNEKMEIMSNSDNDCQILHISSETSMRTEKIGADTNGTDTYIERGNENSVGNLDSRTCDVLGLGKEFETEDEAYNYYTEYATLEGFNVRKDFVNKDRYGIVTSRRFACLKQRYFCPKSGSIPKKPREDTRSGCLAHMTISLKPNGKYRVLHSETIHNHDLDTMVPSKKRTDFPQNDADNLEEVAPKLGMRFNSEDHAYEYYSTYALLPGFSIRKDYVNKSKKNGEVTSRRFSCCRKGSNNKDKIDPKSKTSREKTGIGCLAHLIIVRHLDRKYHVAQYEGKHNHALVPARVNDNFRSEKRLALVHCVEESAPIDTPIKDPGGVYNPVDIESTLRGKRKRDMKEGESEAIFQYFENRKKKDPSLFYSVQLDSEGQMANIFWADSKMLEDYHFFGDVVCFDTIYKLDEGCRPFVSFTGVNHHKQLLIFGVAFLYDDTFESIEWLFQIFLKVMSQRKTKTILTGQDAVLAEVINALFPDTHHRLCAWHVYQKALKVIDQEAQGIDIPADDFKSCFFDFEVKEDFVKAWKTILQKLNLLQNEALNDLFKERQKWAMPYGRHMFCADIKCAQLSDNLLRKVRKYIKSGVDVVSCLNQFTKLLKDWRYNEVQANYDMSNQLLPRLMGDIIMLKHVRDVYTPTIFDLFQQEFEKCLDFVVKQCNNDKTMVEYKTGMHGEVCENTVFFNSDGDSVACSCMKFEFEGILCSHAMKVLDYQNIKVVPARHVLKRWTKDARIENLCSK